MKILYMVAWLSILNIPLYAQRSIRDQSITYQQERMVFKQWDRKKFTPTSGFLGLNPNYWLTWGLHPNYPKTDLRPLGPYGPQTQRMALAAAMQSTANAYKLQADTLSNVAMSEMVNYSSIFSDADPLWLLYYRNQFAPLLNIMQSDPLFGLSTKERDYMVQSGLLGWYLEESEVLAERLNGARSTTLDRGSRIIAYHRMLGEYRKLNATWESKKSRAKVVIALTESTSKIRKRESPIASGGYGSDKQIAEEILSRSKF